MFGLETLFRLLAPFECLNCGAEGSLLCKICLPEAIKPLPLRCFRCHTAEAERICASCRLETGLTDVRVATSYDGMVKQLIRRYKFDRAKDASKTLAELLASALPKLEPSILITFVPTATSRVRERGYDHARLLAVRYAKLQGRKISYLLARSGQSRQVGASRKRRLDQLNNAFRLLRGANVNGKDFLLIDDVVTTGATIQIAAKVLLDGGARSVRALIIAQKV